MRPQTLQTAQRTPEPTSPTATGTGVAASVVARLAGAALALGVAAIHVDDQGGLPGSKTPTYVGVGYYLLEVVGVLVALALVVAPVRQRLAAWVGAGGVAAGPLVGYVLSRGPGLPGYGDDRGNWTEPLGVLSLVVEAALLFLSLVALRASAAVARRD
jgi:hypothetical protein